VIDFGGLFSGNPWDLRAAPISVSPRISKSFDVPVLRAGSQILT